MSHIVCHRSDIDFVSVRTVITVIRIIIIIVKVRKLIVYAAQKLNYANAVIEVVSATTAAASRDIRRDSG